MTKHTHSYGENNIQQNEAIELDRFDVGLLAGSILGGFVGAGVMLLLAPHSGKKTRARLQEQGVKLRNLITERSSGKARQMKDHTHRQAEEVEQSSQAMLDEGAPPIGGEK
jgi:gas vesicle protein